MSYTSYLRGHQKIQFSWKFNKDVNKVIIDSCGNRKGNKMHHVFSVIEIKSILITLHKQFNYDYFPLANNVVKLTDGTEQMGLGRIILAQEGSDVYHSQGSSYLGVILEKCGYLNWNGKRVGIKWQLIDNDFSPESIIARLTQPPIMFDI